MHKRYQPDTSTASQWGRYCPGCVVRSPAGNSPTALAVTWGQPLSPATHRLGRGDSLCHRPCTGQDAAPARAVGPSRIILPDPGVRHLYRFSAILMRFCMSNNSSALSTGRGETERGHRQGHRAGDRVTLRRAVCSGATRCAWSGAKQTQS